MRSKQSQMNCKSKTLGASKRLALVLLAVGFVAAPARGAAYIILDLGTLGGTRSYAYGINASGQVVGYSYTTDDAATHAFRTAANGAIIPGPGGSDLGNLGGTGSSIYESMYHGGQP